MSAPRGLVLVVVLAVSACELVVGIDDRKVAPGDPSANTGGQAKTGGSSGPGGVSGGGGALPTGGSLSTGGLAATGGGTGAAGMMGSGASGGATSAGGATGIGGIGGMGGFTGSDAATSVDTLGTGGMSSMDGRTGDAGPPQDGMLDAPIGSCGSTGVLGNGTGLLGEYFASRNLTSLQVTRVDRTIDFNWPANPDLGIPSDAFSIRWTGQIQARFSGHHTFYTRNDDGIRVWINGTQIIDDWNDHAVTDNSGSIDLVAGQKYSLKIEYYDNTGVAVAQLSWMNDCQGKEVIPTSQLYYTPPTCAAPSIGTGTGVKGEYFDNQDLTALKLTRTDPAIDFSWPEDTSPDPSIAPGSYSVRWTGQVQATYSGSMTFYTVADDGVRLTVDGTLIIDDWNSHGVTENAATINVVAGQKYDLRLDYFEQDLGGQVQLLWGSPCQARQIIPQTQLYPSYGGVVCLDTVPGAGTGLLGEYYDNNDFTNLVVTHAAEAVNFDWGSGSPSPAIGPDTFSVRWTGQVLAQQTGLTTFYAQSDDAARVWVNDQLIIDDWVAHQVDDASGTINLTAGQLYTIRVQYREDAEFASIKLLWSGPCQSKVIIPATQLFPRVNPDGGVDAAPPPGDALPPSVDAGVNG